MRKRSVLLGVLSGRCPQCREGRIFAYHVFCIKKMTSMHLNCPCCHLRFEKEPGNAYGAMFISYAFSTGIFVAVAFILYHFFNDPPIEVYLLLTLCMAGLLFPLNFRYARVVFLYLIWKL